MVGLISTAETKSKCGEEKDLDGEEGRSAVAGGKGSCSTEVTNSRMWFWRASALVTMAYTCVCERVIASRSIDELEPALALAVCRRFSWVGYLASASLCHSAQQLQSSRVSVSSVSSSGMSLKVREWVSERMGGGGILTLLTIASRSDGVGHLSWLNLIAHAILYDDTTVTGYWAWDTMK